MSKSFFCQACLDNKPAKEQSPDPHYCNWCYEFLLKEEEVLREHGTTRRANWMPIVPAGEQSKESAKGGSPTEWSKCGQIRFADGKGYGLKDNLQTICLGKEADIKKFFETGELNNELHPTQKQVLTEIREKELEDGDTGTTDMVRGEPVGTIRHREKSARQNQKRERLPIHTALFQSKGISRQRLPKVARGH